MGPFPSNASTYNEYPSFADPINLSVENQEITKQNSNTIPAPSYNDATISSTEDSYSAPSADNSDFELPDWLKGDVEDESEPVSTSGKAMDNSGDSSGGTDANVHDSFELTPTDQDEKASK